MFRGGYRVSLFLFILTVFAATAQAQDNVIATVFGESLTLDDISPDRKQLSQIARMNSASKDMAMAQYRHGFLADKIVEAVLSHYASAQNISATPELVEKFKARFAEDFSESQPASDEPLSFDDVAIKQVERWLIDKALYEDFGGVVIFQQNNPQMPVGAYEQLLKQYQQKGHFAIKDDNYSAVFWEAFEPPFTFEIEPEQVDFSQPWWLE
ncbi:hypothetical protein [Alteromonas sp. H39]|uniref:hypothetical protein n=1 Tax=Alteromonas sp. H39 TaxID=3389876 RepID=UPI0039DFBB46